MKLFVRSVDRLVSQIQRNTHTHTRTHTRARARAREPRALQYLSQPREANSKSRGAKTEPRTKWLGWGVKNNHDAAGEKLNGTDANASDANARAALIFLPLPDDAFRRDLLLPCPTVGRLLFGTCPDR